MWTLVHRGAERRVVILPVFSCTTVLVHHWRTVLLIIEVNSTDRWKLKRQTNGNPITVDGQKPMLDNGIEKDRIA